MKHINCNVCSAADIPLNHTLKIDGIVHCSSCLETHYPDQKALQGKLVEKEHDPSVCHFCAKDFGNEELTTLSVYPVCPDCRKAIREKTFPLWVKGFFAAILLIVVFSFIWNWKYYSAYNNLKESFVLLDQGDIQGARDAMESAESSVPESYDLAVLGSYLRGIDLLSQDKGKEALAELRKCEGQLPESYGLEPMLIRARMAAAFDDKDYDGFLEAAKDNFDLDSLQADSYAIMASAYACRYAAKDDEADKAKAVEYLGKAKKTDTANTEKLYYSLIEYRLATKNIIDRKEFEKKYPEGWNPNQ